MSPSSSSFIFFTLKWLLHFLNHNLSPRRRPFFYSQRWRLSTWLPLKQRNKNQIRHPAQPATKGQRKLERPSKAQQQRELPPQHDGRIRERKVGRHPLLVALNIGFLAPHGDPATQRRHNPRQPERLESSGAKGVQVGPVDNVERANAGRHDADVVHAADPRVDRGARVLFRQFAGPPQAREVLERAQRHGNAAAPDVRAAREEAQHAPLELGERVAVVPVWVGEDEVKGPAGGDEGGKSHELPCAAPCGVCHCFCAAGCLEEGGGGGGRRFGRGWVAVLAGLAGAEGRGRGAAGLVQAYESRGRLHGCGAMAGRECGVCSSKDAICRCRQMAVVVVVVTVVMAMVSTTAARGGLRAGSTVHVPSHEAKDTAQEQKSVDRYQAYLFWGNRDGAKYNSAEAGNCVVPRPLVRPRVDGAVIDLPKQCSIVGLRIPALPLATAGSNLGPAGMEFW